MQLDRQRFSDVLDFFSELRLVGRDEVDEVLALLDRRFPFANTLERAESVHVHVRVDDVAALPHDRIRAFGSGPENAKDGYVKYPFAGGLNMIFSSIPVAQDDLLADRSGAPKRPFVDHLGVDLREESDAARTLFDRVPARAALLGWRHAAQGGPGKPVYCCHVEVAEKHWVYPAEGAPWKRPIEFAYGALKVNEGTMGCDLRPIDPTHPEAASVANACCGPAHEETHAGNGSARAASGYYEAGDLAQFAEVGRFASATMEKFWVYYGAATATDGALTRREKALIALAVAHAKQCPYCIEAYTSQCLDAGSNPEQMHEAIHVAAALSAGIDLVHGVQMQKTLRARGAI